MQKARALGADATIGVIATGSPLAEGRYTQAVAQLEKRGFSVRCPIPPHRYYGDYTHGFTNGSAEERADAFMELVRDESVDVILTARGGYGCLDILPLINYEELARSRKLLIGMSDVTALLLQSVSRAKLPAVHGAALGTAFADYEQSEAAKKSADALLALLSNPAERFRCTLPGMRDGEGSGRLIAGNLSMLTAVLGTPWDVQYGGAVVVLEEVGDPPFRIHRSLTQLKLAGKLDNLAALVFGRFSRSDSKHGPSADEVKSLAVGDILRHATYPILEGLEFGHWGENQPIPLGCKARVKSAKGSGLFEILESPIES